MAYLKMIKAEINATEKLYLKQEIHALSLSLSVNGWWRRLQVGSKEQQMNHSQRFLFFCFFIFLLMVHVSLFFPLAFSLSRL